MVWNEFGLIFNSRFLVTFLKFAKTETSPRCPRFSARVWPARCSRRPPWSPACSRRSDARKKDSCNEAKIEIIKLYLISVNNLINSSVVCNWKICLHFIKPCCWDFSSVRIECHPRLWEAQSNDNTHTHLGYFPHYLTKLHKITHFMLELLNGAFRTEEITREEFEKT